MPSPFPGMNPYLEQHDLWHGFHLTFLSRLQASLNTQLVPNNFADLDETVSVATNKKIRCLVIRNTKSLEISTVIELLHPAHKVQGADRERYISKQNEAWARQTSIIELDLLRGGKRLPIRNLPDCNYYALVSRWWERPKMGLWPIQLREPLPTIPVPLRRGEKEPTIELKAILDRAYDEGAYAYRIYGETLEPPLSEADAEWAKAFVPAPTT